MILTGSEIKKQIKKGRIIIAPFSCELINPNSYNYRLGETLRIVSDEVIDVKNTQNFETITIPKEGYLLRPGRIYLGHTFETIGSNKFVTSLIGRSSIGRLGMFLQITADLGQLGNAHQWTLEIKVVQPLKIYPKMKIGQLSFWCPSGKIDSLYERGYTQYDSPQVSNYQKYFNK